MAVLLKRSTNGHLPLECTYGCCTILYGKSVAKLRRTVKRSEKSAWRREAARGE